MPMSAEDKKLANEALGDDMEKAFLPDGYEIPTSNTGYMKFQNGENKFRPLSSPITGMEYWVTDNGKRRPVRVKPGVKIDYADLEDTKPPRHFWAFVVWDYSEEAVQILEITQKTIQRGIQSLVQNEDWGNPKGINGYDILVNKTGEGKESTKYTVMPVKPKKLDEGIWQMYKDMDIKLERLYDGGDPFAE